MTDITRSNKVHITFQHKGVRPMNFTKREGKKSDRAMQVVGLNYEVTVTTYLNVLDTQY